MAVFFALLFFGVCGGLTVSMALTLVSLTLSLPHSLSLSFSLSLSHTHILYPCLLPHVFVVFPFTKEPLTCF